VKDPHVIHPHAIYTVKALQDALGLAPTTIRREVRLRRLRVARRAGKYFILGKWILDWIESGEVNGQQKRNSDLTTSAGEQPGDCSKRE
jgi:hypothetical protein